MTDSDDTHLVALVLGKPYPFPENFPPITTLIGARPEFLSAGHNTLHIILADMEYTDSKLIRHGTLTGGVFVKEDYVHLLWEFKDKKNRSIQFDGPFDVRLIDKDLLTLPSTESPKERLVMSVIGIEAETTNVFAIRSITWHPKFFFRFFNALDAQFATPYNREKMKAYQRSIEQIPTAELIKQTTMYSFGK